VIDNYKVWEYAERERERRLARLPICEGFRCGKRIQDEDYYDVDGEILCEECMKQKYRRKTEDLINEE
jgi:formylmethanofuran dehydrogenase subunit E